MDESGQPIPTPQAVDLVTIAAYRDLSEALVLKGRLNSAGIACFLVDDNIVRLDWFWSYLMKGVKLRVPATEAEIARSLVRNEGEAEPGEMEIPVCPRCGSRKIAVVDPARGIRLAALSFLLLPLPRIGEPHWECVECGSAWIEEPEPDVSPGQPQKL